jgi:hypothetical protein
MLHNNPLVVFVNQHKPNTIFYIEEQQLAHNFIAIFKGVLFNNLFGTIYSMPDYFNKI